DAGQAREALRLLAAEHATLYYTGREATVRRTLDRITAEAIVPDLAALVELAWCEVLIDRRRFVELVDEAVFAARDAEPDEVELARLMMLRSMAATMTGAWVEGGALARQAVTNLAERSWRDSLARFGWNMVARSIALSEEWDDSNDEVRRV